MNIIGKSACTIEQLQDRYSKGFENIEIQLLSDFITVDLDVDAYFNIIVESNVDIKAIHVPLMGDSDDLNLEFISDPLYYKAFFNYCKLAQMCSEHFKHDVTIVMHNSIPLEMYEKMSVLFHFIKNTLQKALEDFPNIVFSIENLVAVLLKNNYCRLKSFAFYENVELAKYFNEHFNTNRFYTTLDICHMLSSIKTINNYKDEEYFSNFTFTIEEFFKQNKDVINNIHLNNIHMYGFSEGDHGMYFNRINPLDEVLLRHLIELYIKYEYTCNITIEVFEPDLSNAYHSEETKEFLCDLLTEYGLEY